MSHHRFIAHSTLRYLLNRMAVPEAASSCGDILMSVRQEALDLSVKNVRDRHGITIGDRTLRVLRAHPKRSLSRGEEHSHRDEETMIGSIILCAISAQTPRLPAWHKRTERSGMKGRLKTYSKFRTKPAGLSG